MTTSQVIRSYTTPGDTTSMRAHSRLVIVTRLGASPCRQPPLFNRMNPRSLLPHSITDGLIADTRDGCDVTDGEGAGPVLRHSTAITDNTPVSAIVNRAASFGGNRREEPRSGVSPWRLVCVCRVRDSRCRLDRDSSCTACPKIGTNRGDGPLTHALAGTTEVVRTDRSARVTALGNKEVARAEVATDALSW
jgi:hypothetical protein